MFLSERNLVLITFDTVNSEVAKSIMRRLAKVFLKVLNYNFLIKFILLKS